MNQEVELTVVNTDPTVQRIRNNDIVVRGHTDAARIGKLSFASSLFAKVLEILPSFGKYNNASYIEK
jgi:hypothetical protein